MKGQRHQCPLCIANAEDIAIVQDMTERLVALNVFALVEQAVGGLRYCRVRGEPTPADYVRG